MWRATLPRDRAGDRRRRTASMLAPGTGERPLGRRFVDDAKVTDHHAIIPTATPPAKPSLAPDERKIYDLVCRRLLQAWHDDHVWSRDHGDHRDRATAQIVDRYHTTGTRGAAGGLEGARHRAREGEEAAKSQARGADEAEQTLPPGLAPGPAAGRARRGGGQEEDPRRPSASPRPRCSRRWRRRARRSTTRNSPTR